MSSLRDEPTGVLADERLPGDGESHAARPGTDPLEALCGYVRYGATVGIPGSREVTCALCLAIWEERWASAPRYEKPGGRK